MVKYLGDSSQMNTIKSDAQYSDYPWVPAPPTINSYLNKELLKNPIEKPAIEFPKEAMEAYIESLKQKIKEQNS